MQMKKRVSKNSEREETEETSEKNLDTAMKVVQIMQVIAEDLGDGEKKMWRKMLGEDSKSDDEI